MRKFLFVSAILTLLLLCIALPVSAEEGTTNGDETLSQMSSDFVYEVVDGIAKVVGYTGEGGDIVIPETVMLYTGSGATTSMGTYDVTKIANTAFTGNTTITSVTLPSTLVEIEGVAGQDGAFENCTSLVSVNFPSSLKKIGWSAFEKCTSLKNVQLNEGLEVIGARAFFGCTNEAFNAKPEGGTYDLPTTLKELHGAAFQTSGLSGNIKIPSTVTVFGTHGGWTFCECPNLVSVDFSEATSITEIQTGTFTRCTSLTSVILNDNITAIGDVGNAGGNYGVFEGCTSLTNVVFPANLKEIGYRAFHGCSSATFSTKNGDTTTPNLPAGLNEIGPAAFHMSGISGEVIIPSTVRNFGSSWIFAECKNITKVIFNNQLTDINEAAFYQCTALESVVLPSNLEHIHSGHGEGDYQNTGVFSGCTSLTSVTFPENTLWQIGNYTFFGCTALQSVTIPESVRDIGDSAFESTGLTSIELPGHYEELGMRAFAYCTNLATANIPNGITVIKNGVFRGAALTSIEIHDRIEHIMPNAFKGTKIKEVNIPASVKRIDEGAFATNGTLESVNFYGHQPYIGDNAFGGNADVVIYFIDGANGYGYPTWAPYGVEFNTSPTIEPNVKFRIENIVYDRNTDHIEVDVYMELYEIYYNQVSLSNFNQYPMLELVDIINYPTGALSYYDADRDVLVLGNENGDMIHPINGKICTLVYKVNNKNFYGALSLRFDALVKRDSTIIPSPVHEGILLHANVGDINIDGHVDIRDAIELLKHNHWFEAIGEYPIQYIDNINFYQDKNENGNEIHDSKDALALYRHSMLPGIYPVFQNPNQFNIGN